MAIDLSGLDPWSSIGGSANSSSVPSSGSSLSSIGGALGSFAGPIGSIAGSLLGGMFGGGEDASAARAAYRRQVDLTQWSQDFDREMSNTAIARRTRDLTASGINPMLAYMGSGSGSSASSPESPTLPVLHVGSGIAKAQSAMQAAQMGRETMLSAAELAKTLSETKLVDAQTAETQARTPTYAANIDLANSQIARLVHENDLTDSQTNQLIATWEQTVADTNLKQAEKMKILLHDLPFIDAQTAKSLSEITNIQAELPFIRAKSSVSSGFADLLHLPDASKFINSAASGLGRGTAAGVSGASDVFDGVSNFFKPDSNRRNWRLK